MSLFGDLSDVHVDKPGPWPEGEYPGVVVEAVKKPTRAGTGSFLELKWQINNDKGATRTVLQRITITNPNEDAVKIGKQQAKALQDAINKGPIQDPQWFIGKKCTVFIGQEPSYNDPDKIFNVFKYPVEAAEAKTAPITNPNQDLGENDVF